MRRGLAFLAILLFILSLINVSILFYETPLTGLGISSAAIGLTILETRTFNITSPLNDTYNFDAGDNYTLWLNVTPNDFDTGDATWNFTLYDRNDNIVNDSFSFSPNTTFNAQRWQNTLVVSADISGSVITSNVSFYINVSDSAPVIQGLNSSISVCEDSNLDYWFNVTDEDYQILHVTTVPSNPFYVTPEWTSENIKTTQINFYSGVLPNIYATQNGDDWRVYQETIGVTDQVYTDYVDVNLTIIGINDAPLVPTIGVQTVQTKGDNSTFYYFLNVTDEEDGNSSSDNIMFNISFSQGEDLFEISNDGVMNFTPNSSQVGVYNITVCVNDSGIDYPHENISICNQDGGSIVNCQEFSLTVTDENRAPTILNYYPDSLDLSVSGENSLYFNITKYDPDGTIPDSYWYVDEVLVEYDGNSSQVDEFSHSFGCGVSGAKEVKVVSTDGLLNDSVTWNVNVIFEECSVATGTGGGGGGIGPSCTEKWGCSLWWVCQNTEKSLKEGLLSGEDYRIIKEDCELSGLDENFCGVQIRKCVDVHSCGTDYHRPDEFQSCHYTEDPNCNDGIKNCHSDSCELLVDCGGPCDPCPSCSDKIENQGEEGVDCGGPCPWKCPEEIPLLRRPKVLYSFLIIILLLILILIIKFRKVILYSEELKKRNV